MLSGTIVGEKKGYFGVEIDWSAAQNKENNKSVVTSKVYITYYSINISSRTGGISVIDGTEENFTTSSINHNAGTSYRRLVYTQHKEVEHNTDGTKNVVLYASFPFNLTSSSAGTVNTLSASATVTLDPIPRASTVSSFSFTNGYIDQGFDITISSKLSSYYHDIHLYIPDTSGVGINLIDSSVGRKQGGTHHIDFSDEQLQILYNAMPTATSSKFTVYVRTYTTSTSSTTIGDWQTASSTGNIPVTLKPSITLSSTIASGDLNGYYVQNKSSAKLTASGNASKGSCIVSYTFKGANITSTSSATTIKTASTSYVLTTSTIHSSGTLKYEVIVQDARGRTASAQISITVYGYSKPQISSASVQRCTSDGVIDSNGTYAKYTVNSYYSPISIDGTINNPRTVTIAYSSDDGSTYSSETIIQSDTNTSNSASGVYGAGAFTATSSYKIKFTITDNYGAVDTKIVPLSSAERPINVRADGKGIGLGQISENQNSIETPWDIHFTDTESQMLLFKNGSKSGWEASLYKGGSSDTAVVGVWDRTNQKPVWQYKNDGRFYIQNKVALTEGERSGNARLLTNVYSKCFSSNQTGYIAIRLGTATLSLTSMITIKGHVTSYQNSTSFEASCYFYNAESKFHGAVATISNPDVLREVYFAEGNPSGYVYLIIGASNASWNYPTVVIDSLSIGWANVDSTAFESGWTASVYTSLSSNFTKITACVRGGLKRTLWAGGAASINTTLTLSENMWNFKFLTCILGDDTSPLGIVLGTFLDEEILELHFGAIYTETSGFAGADLFGAKFEILGNTSIKLLGAASEVSSNLKVRKIVGWR